MAVMTARARGYFLLVQNKKMTIEQVPDAYRPVVQAAFDALAQPLAPQ